MGEWNYHDKRKLHNEAYMDRLNPTVYASTKRWLHFHNCRIYVTINLVKVYFRLWGSPWSYMQPTTEVNGTLIGYHRKMDRRWWRAQVNHGFTYGYLLLHYPSVEGVWELLRYSGFALPYEVSNRVYMWFTKCSTTLRIWMGSCRAGSFNTYLWIYRGCFTFHQLWCENTILPFYA